jgi:hypothetical protein
VTAEDLNAGGADQPRRLDALCEGRCCLAGASVVGLHSPGRFVHEQPRAVQRHLHVGDQERERLVVRDRPAEGLALLRVLA